MNQHLRRFKRVLAQTADAYGEDFHTAFETRDLLLDLGPDPSPAEIVARGIVQYCQTGGQYNGFELGVVAMVQFLSETLTKLPANALDPDVELMAILKRGGITLELLRQWAARYYG